MPHCHIEGVDFRCSMGITSLEVIVGTTPASVVRAARDWVRAHQALLMQTWQELNG